MNRGGVMGLPLYAPFLGYYNPADNLIMATGGRTGYGTLLHEMIHALIEADFPQAPPWLNEGLASLYERTQWTPARLNTLPNWRMDRMREDNIPSLQVLAGKAKEIGLHSNENAEIRLLLLFLDQRQLVDDLYRMAKEEGSSFSLEEALPAMGVNEKDWRLFVKNTFRDYRAELARDRGALSNPDEVRFLQQALNQILGAHLKVDGIWGPSSREKLVRFQKMAGLKPDGIPGPRTMAELKRRYMLNLVEQLEGGVRR
ncbi:peptidoglycan-binding domain-containing protein [Desulfolithobacter sp.]